METRNSMSKRESTGMKDEGEMPPMVKEMIDRTVEDYGKWTCGIRKKIRLSAYCASMFLVLSVTLRILPYAESFDMPAVATDGDIRMAGNEQYAGVVTYCNMGCSNIDVIELILGTINKGIA